MYAFITIHNQLKTKIQTNIHHQKRFQGPRALSISITTSSAQFERPGFIRITHLMRSSSALALFESHILCAVRAPWFRYDNTSYAPFERLGSVTITHLMRSSDAMALSDSTRLRTPLLNSAPQVCPVYGLLGAASFETPQAGSRTLPAAA